jgi:hypothetical protein
MNVTRISAGNYRVEVAGRVFFVQRFCSDYGDYQWMIDEQDGETTLAQTDTLAQAKATICALAN